MSYDKPIDPPYNSPLRYDRESINASEIPGRGTLYMERKPDSIVFNAYYRRRMHRLWLVQGAAMLALVTTIVGGAKAISNYNKRPPHCQFFGETIYPAPPAAGAEVLARRIDGIIDGSNVCLDAAINQLVELNPDVDVLNPVSGMIIKSPEVVVIDGKNPAQVSLSSSSVSLSAAP